MKKISVIFWSNGGNVEILSDNIAKGAEEAGAKVNIKHVQFATLEDVLEADAIAFGSPSMDNNKVEQQEMAPFINKFKLMPNAGKKVVLFGSYGWDDGKFMEEWESQMKDFGFDVVETFVIKESPTEAQIEKAKELGKILAV